MLGRGFSSHVYPCPSDDEMFSFHFKRKQRFPVRLSFAMTVNRSQGQTIPNVGVYLPEPVFNHGQLYVALSRATGRSNINILAIPAIDGDNNNKKKNKKKTKGDEEKNSFTINDGIYTKKYSLYCHDLNQITGHCGMMECTNKPGMMMDSSRQIYARNLDVHERGKAIQLP
ncbi:hypothetical protein U9M48_012821 [Paspalum notatum var. saurae]|uniref:ATP-dependent DNA helicase n=1 Tax=Paspalum notatum var. saurae TaxID=547442 RepID=A0AAQ3SYP9_PASNO